ncbi:Oidioi.mRNA.OKI2018_I69.PAR.g9744.t1.cds [Oikopleura dioica]|uniref:Oidioi.mRNA.OKI2018_I69.PAR.g9744.t1.cds n=1 Tax=Oikopleura dioica TaxID=34765 RepID=A0ABN7RSX7_OIKDI|nr:Oidioi.mRNA.OKI2018_I69.PAR.g9744.t1.cds [Oikopleura dioica]
MAKFILKSTSKLRITWDTIVLIFLAIDLFLLPLDAAMGDQVRQIYSARFYIDILFLLDLALNFRTSDKSDRTKIIREDYFKGWFVIDFLSSFPFEFLFYRHHSSLEWIGKILRLLRLTRLFRYMKNIRAKIRFEYSVTEIFFKMLTLAGLILIWGHYGACLLIFTAKKSTSDGHRPENAIFTPSENMNFNWYYANDLHEATKTFGEIYITALFKSMSCTLTIGYGLYTPVNESDVVVTMVVIFFGAIIFALIVSQLIAMMDQINVGSLKFKRHLQEVGDYLRFNRIPKPLRQSVREFYDVHYKKRIFDEASILKELNPLLSEEVRNCGRIDSGKSKKISAFLRKNPAVIVKRFFSLIKRP